MSGSKRTWIAPLALVAVVVATATAFMIGNSGDDGGGGAPAASVANPHPAAGTFVADDTEVYDCDEQACYEQAFGNIVFEEGPKAAFEVFDRAIAAGGPIASGCHRIAHAMGGAALARYEGDVSTAFSEGSSSCWSGYYHGILEWALEDVPSSQLGPLVGSLCDDVREQGTFLLYQCIHGLGHGLMITTGYDLPEALETCEATRDEWETSSCTGGVFMENIATGEGSPIEVTGRPEWLDRDDLLYPCNDEQLVAESIKYDCYVLVTTRILEANGRDWADAARWCERAEPPWIPTCFQSLGRDASGSTAYDPKPTLRLCDKAAQHEADCVWGAARDYTMRHAGIREAESLCKLAPADLRGTCFNGIGTIVPTLEDELTDQLAACEAVVSRYSNDCVRGAMTRGLPVGQ